MLKQFKYTKANGDESYRTVYPIRVVDDKLLSIDMSGFTDKERADSIAELDEIHKAYVKAIADAGYAGNYRMFFLGQMS